VLVAGRHGGVSPAHESHDGALGDAQDEEHGGGGVASVVKPAVPDARRLEELLPLVIVAARVDRLAGRRREYPATVLPELPGSLAVAVLLGTVLAGQCGQLGRQADAPAAVLRFVSAVAARAALRSASVRAIQSRTVRASSMSGSAPMWSKTASALREVVVTESGGGVHCGRSHRPVPAAVVMGGDVQESGEADGCAGEFGCPVCEVGEVAGAGGEPGFDGCFEVEDAGVGVGREWQDGGVGPVGERDDQCAEVVGVAGGAGPPPEPGHLPLRDRYLPDLVSVLNIAGRLCAGGPPALCAIARPATHNRGPDYLLLIQERSGRVLNAARRLAVIPKSFHGPLVDCAEDAQIHRSVEREMDEELFGRDDVDSVLSGQRSADPMHRSRLSPPMLALTDRAGDDSWRMDCTGYGYYLLTGDYEFATLIAIHDETWWDGYGGHIEAN
jgi:hypothetical protein